MYNLCINPCKEVQSKYTANTQDRPLFLFKKRASLEPPTHHRIGISALTELPRQLKSYNTTQHKARQGKVPVQSKVICNLIYMTNTKFKLGIIMHE